MITSPKPIVWFDMDGVMSDWLGGVSMEFGKPYGRFNQSEKSKFWNRQVTETGLFTKLKEIDRGLYLYMQILGEEIYDVRLFTSTGGGSKHFEIIMHKAQWLMERGFSVTDVAFCAVPGAWKKVNYVTPGAVLIDDNIETITQWNDAGGDGLLFTVERAEGIFKWLQNKHGAKR